MMGSSELSTTLLLPLGTAALRGFAVAGVAALALTALRVRATSIRLFTWTAVLYVAIAMPVLQLLLPPLPVPMPRVLESRARPTLVSSGSLAAGNAAARMSLSLAPYDRVTKGRGADVVRAPSLWSQLPWIMVAAAGYFVVLAILLARILAGMSLERRLRRASREISDDRITARIIRSARAHGLGFVPQPAETALVSVPLTMGVLRSILLFPNTWRGWDDIRLDAVIAHEMSHVARRDCLTRQLSMLHCAIFWFSPLAWWLNRHLADLAERASDEAALAWGVDRDAYARTLLNFLESLQGMRGRVRWQGISMANAGRAEQRLERILTWKGTVGMSLRKSIAVLVILLAAPVVYLTASAHPDRHVDSQHPAVVDIARLQTPAQPAPAAPAMHTKHGTQTTSVGRSYVYDYDDDLGFVIVSGSGDSFTMSGMNGDDEHVRELRKTIADDFIWFRRDGKSYIIRDQDTVRRAKSFWAPQAELGKQQEELGRQQEELGRQQEELSKQMEQIRVDIPDVMKEMEQLQAELKKLGTSATSEQIGEIQSKIGELQSKIGESQSKAGERQSKIGEQMGALGEKQGKLGELQGKLGEKQGKLAEEASKKMKSLLDEALTKGTAQPEK